jgi:ribosomal protein S18 acetylase RimI-like enzyme
MAVPAEGRCRKQRGRRVRETAIRKIRPAGPADAVAIAALVGAAYAMYIPRMGKEPGPMLADYDAIVVRGEASVLEIAGALAGVVVLIDEPDHLLLENVAVAPERKGQGLGRRLVAFSEGEARRRGYAEIRLYAHETMTENQALYTHLGFVETHRAEQDGYARVFMTKRL